MSANTDKCYSTRHAKKVLAPITRQSINTDIDTTTNCIMFVINRLSNQQPHGVAFSQPTTWNKSHQLSSEVITKPQEITPMQSFHVGCRGQVQRPNKPAVSAAQMEAVHSQIRRSSSSWRNQVLHPHQAFWHRTQAKTPNISKQHNQMCSYSPTTSKH